MIIYHDQKYKTRNKPKSLLTNGWTLNGSKSSICSPVPIKITGLRVAATLKRHSQISV